MTAPDSPAELRRLQLEFVDLIEGHRPSTWPPNLFRIVNAAICLHFGTESLSARPKLRLLEGGKGAGIYGKEPRNR